MSEWVPGDILPYAVVLAGEALERAFAAVMAREGLTLRHFGILSHFANSEVLTAAAIARALEVTPQSIGPQIDALHARGLITRSPGRGRGRPNELRLTDDGRETLVRTLAIARAVDARWTGHLAAAEQRTMLAQLREMTARATGEAATD